MIVCASILYLENVHVFYCEQSTITKIILVFRSTSNMALQNEFCHFWQYDACLGQSYLSYYFTERYNKDWSNLYRTRVDMPMYKL